MRKPPYDLVTSPAFQVLSASDSFKNPTQRVNETQQTDLTQLKVIRWGWYYLCSVLDDCSRYLLAWRLFPRLATRDVQDARYIAPQWTGVTQVKIENRPRLLSELAEVVDQRMHYYNVERRHSSIGYVSPRTYIEHAR